jgi:hypothetical protein
LSEMKLFNNNNNTNQDAAPWRMKTLTAGD